MILIDGIAFTNNHQKGIQRYFVEVLSRLSAELPISMFFDAPQRVAAPSGCTRIVRTERFVTPRRLVHAYALRALRRRIAPTALPKPSVFHSTYYTRSPISGVPEVVTVYDMIVEQNPYRFGRDCDEQVRIKAPCIQAAAHVITISQTTADELAEFYPQLRGRITAIPLGGDHLLHNRDSVAPSQNDNFCLYVGDRFRYKNFETVLMGVASPAWNRDLKLHVIGPPAAFAEKLLIERMKIGSRICFLGHVTDPELAQAYRSCAACICPSLYEGFGLSVIEAQAGGAPLACSDTPIFREVAGTAAHFFDPRDADSLVDAVNRAVAEGRTTSAVSARRANVSRFSWDECAHRTQEIWRAVGAG